MAEPNRPLRILVVDDNPGDVRLVLMALHGTEYEVTTVSYGKSALDLIPRFLPDMVLLDVNLPDMSGFDVLHAMRANARTSSIPVIILTGAALDVRDIRHGLELGADDYLSKEFQEEELIARIISKIDRRILEIKLKQRNQELEALLREYEGRREVDNRAGTHIFISYSSADSDFAHQLADLLMMNGFDVWIDNQQLRSGDNWWDSIIKALRKCSAFIVIMTSAAKQSRWVQREVTLADMWEKPTFPLLVEGENWELYVLTHYENMTKDKKLKDSFFQRLGEIVPPTSQGKNVLEDFPESNT